MRFSLTAGRFFTTPLAVRKYLQAKLRSECRLTGDQNCSGFCENCSRPGDVIVEGFHPALLAGGIIALGNLTKHGELNKIRFLLR
jgi:hypothetical protein